MCDSGDPKVWVWKLSPDLMYGEWDYLIFRAEKPPPTIGASEQTALLEVVKQTLEFINDDRDMPAEPHEIKLELTQMRESKIKEIENSS